MGVRVAPTSAGNPTPSKKRRKTRSAPDRCGVPKSEFDCKRKIKKFVHLDNADIYTELEYVNDLEVRCLSVALLILLASCGSFVSGML